MSNLKTQIHNSNLKSNTRYRTYKFSLIIIDLIQKFNDKKTFFSIRDQLLRSGTSIGANIIEAKSASSKRDFIKFYGIALKSANETLYWLYLTRDSNLVDKDLLSPIISEGKEVANMIASSLLTMKNKKL